MAAAANINLGEPLQQQILTTAAANLKSNEQQQQQILAAMDRSSNK